MNSQKTTGYVNRVVCSVSLGWTLAALIVAVIFACPMPAWSQAAEWTVYNRTNSGLPFNGVTAIAIDARGTVWVGTGKWYAFDGGGLAKFDGANWSVYNTANSPLPGNDHISLSIDAQGNIWSGTETGLSKFDGQNWTVYLTSNSGLPDNQAGAPVFDAEGNAWIGTGAGVAKFDGQNWTVYNQANSGAPGGLITGVAIDAQGVLWAGTFGSGLVKFSGQNWTTYNTGNSGLTNNSISFMCVVPDGSLWTGTYGGGLIHFADGRWTTFTTSNSPLPHNMVWNVAADPRGSVWAATQGGLAVFDGSGWTVYDRTNSGLPDNDVYCAAFDARGSIWVGTANGGLAVFRPRPVVDFNSDEIVDINDLLILIEHWGTNEPLCDIGPTYWGDGVVDAADLQVLMSYWGQTIPNPALIAHWRLDEAEGVVAADSAGTNDGTLIGNPFWQPTGGRLGGALQLDGVGTCISTPFVCDPSQGPLSVFAWVKGGAPGQVIVSQVNGANWLMLAPSGALMTELKQFGRQGKVLTSAAVVTDGAWHRVGLVCDGSNRILYVDDVEVARDTQAGLESARTGLHIGAGKGMETGSFFSGLIDDVRVYNQAVSP